MSQQTLASTDTACTDLEEEMSERDLAPMHTARADLEKEGVGVHGLEEEGDEQGHAFTDTA